MLDKTAVERYRETGIHFPLEVMSAEEAEGLRRRFAAIEADHGGRMPGHINHKPHLLYPWLFDLVTHPRILDAVEAVLAPDLFCWSSQFFAKPARDPSFVSWHQDATYWGLSSPDVATAWVALTPSTPENGCMRVVPGSHKSQMPHTDTFAVANMLTRGQEVAAAVDEGEAVDVVLRPGQMSLHHVLIVHGSEPNRSDIPRIGFAIRYVPPHVRQASGARDYATLVRGNDAYGHFDHEVRPEADLHPAAVARHRAIAEHQRAILYAGAAQAGKRAAL